MHARCFSVARNSPERGHERDRNGHSGPGCLPPCMTQTFLPQEWPRRFSRAESRPLTARTPVPNGPNGWSMRTPKTSRADQRSHPSKRGGSGLGARPRCPRSRVRRLWILAQRCHVCALKRCARGVPVWISAIVRCPYSGTNTPVSMHSTLRRVHRGQSPGVWPIITSPTSPTQREFCRFSRFSTTQVIELLNPRRPNSPQYRL